jgi:hypothetical protein
MRAGCFGMAIEAEKDIAFASKHGIQRYFRNYCMIPCKSNAADHGSGIHTPDNRPPDE